jgi:hypothetical protein
MRAQNWPLDGVNGYDVFNIGALSGFLLNNLTATIWGLVPQGVIISGGLADWVMERHRQDLGLSNFGVATMSGASAGNLFTGKMVSYSGSPNPANFPNLSLLSVTMADFITEDTLAVPGQKSGETFNVIWKKFK